MNLKIRLKLFVTISLLLMSVACQKAEKTNKKNSNTEITIPKEKKSIQEDSLQSSLSNQIKDSILSIFSDLTFYRQTYYLSLNLKENYPEIETRIKANSKGSESQFSDLSNLLDLYKTNNKESHIDEIDSLNQKILKFIYSKEELEEIRNIQHEPILIDSSLSDSENLKNLIERYRIIDYYFKSQSYFRDSLKVKFWEICPLYWKLNNKIREGKISLYDSIKSSILNQKAPFKDNELFIQSLILKKNDTDKPKFLKTIVPIYYQINNTANIPTEYKNESDQLIFDNSTIPDQLKDSNEIILTKLIMDSTNIKTNNSDSIYSYSLEKKGIISDVRVGYLTNGCADEYMTYFVEGDSNKPLIASTLNLELVYKNYPDIDRWVSNYYPDVCADCPSGISDLKTFAKLEGYDNIFFLATRKKDLDDTDTYLRAVFYVDSENMIPLWTSEYDAYGCSCL